MRPERPGLRTERLDLRPERLDLRLERLNLRPEMPDLRSQRPDLRAERPDEGGGQTNGRTNEWTDQRKSPCVLQAGLSYTAILSTIQYQYNISKYWDNAIQYQYNTISTEILYNTLKLFIIYIYFLSVYLFIFACLSV